MNRIARIISILFHPLGMPVLGCLILFYSGSYLAFMPQGLKEMILLIILTGMVLLPLSLIPIYMYRKLISNLDFSKRNERFLPLLITTILYYLTFLILKRIPISGLILGMVGSATISLFFLSLVTIKYNISLHAAGSGGLFGFLLAITLRLGLFSPLSLYGSVLLAGLAGTARLKQNAHEPAEIYLGYLAGFVFCFVFNFYLRIQ
jgi:hypothetical protein